MRSILFYLALSITSGGGLSLWGQERSETDSASPSHRVIVISKRSLHATLDLEIETKLRAKEWYLYVPQPPELPGQIGITSELSPQGREGRELSNYRRPILSARVKGDGTSPSRVGGQVKYTITLLARSLVPRRAGDPASAPELLANDSHPAWLAPSPLCNFREREFQRWLNDVQLIRQEHEPVIDFGRRVFDYLRKEFEYELLNEMNRKATFVCRDKKSDCMGMSVLYVSVMRANRIPARILVGRWARSSVEGETFSGIAYNQEHVKCEFFADQVGWVPVDVASAQIQEREHAAARYFGLDTADFITLHVNDQWTVQPGPLGRRTLSFVQDVAVWVIGQGESSTLKIDKQWRVESAASIPGKIE